MEDIYEIKKSIADRNYFLMLKEAESILSAIYVEIGPYCRDINKKISPALRQRVNKFYGFNDGEQI